MTTRRGIWVIGPIAGLLVGTLTPAVALAGAGGRTGEAKVGTITAWNMRSDHLDYIGSGRDYSFDPDRISVSGDDTLISASAGGFTAYFEPDSGRTLQAGTTFPGATRYPFNGIKPGLSVSGRGRGCNRVKGSFTVLEAAYDTGGQVEQLSLSFVQHCEGDEPALYGSIAWNADNEPAPLPPRLSIATDAGEYAFGRAIHVTAALSPDALLRTVSIYATPNGGTPRLVKRGTVNASGLLAAKVSASRRMTFTARWDGQGQFPDRAARTPAVTVAAKVTPTIHKYLRQVGRYYVFKTTGTAWIYGRVSPNHAGDCLFFRAEFKVRLQWCYPTTTDCVTLGPTSVARAYLTGRDEYLGVRIRLRAEWRGDEDNTKATSAWRYVRFVRP